MSEVFQPLVEMISDGVKLGRNTIGLSARQMNDIHVLSHNFIQVVKHACAILFAKSFHAQTMQPPALKVQSNSTPVPSPNDP